jgi:hypothetical protein
MEQRKRILIGLVALVLLAAVAIGGEALRRRSGVSVQASGATMTPGSIPIYLDGKLAGSFAPADLQQLGKASFVEPVEGKTQDGWLLRDVINLHIPAGELKPETRIVVSSSSRDKYAELSWKEVNDPSNMVMFDLSNRGTLKLVSKMENLNTRDEWIQDSDKIEIFTP